MTYETLIYEIENGVASITINRPAQLNAIDVLTAKELALAAKQCNADFGRAMCCADRRWRPCVLRGR